MMRESLRSRLSWWLTGVMLVAGVTAGVISFWLAFDEAHGIQDAQLRDMAELVAGGSVAVSPESMTLDVQATSLPGIHMAVQTGPQPHAMNGVPLAPVQGFQTINVRGDSWRVYVSLALAPDYIVVAQRTDARDEIARDSALRTIVPILGLIPALVLLSYAVVRRTLSPVARLALALDRQTGTILTPLHEQDVPQELLPFVTSTNRLMQRVNATLLGQRRFVADAAHELRTPLMVLSTQLQNIEQAPTFADVQQRLQPLKKGVERARRVVDQLLSLARQQTIEASVTAEEVDWAAVTKNIVEEYHRYAEIRGVDLGVTRLEAVTVEGNAESFSILARNAIENALHYTPAGGRVDVRVYRAAEGSVFEVEDTGPGIAAAELDKVFEPFYRVPGSPGVGTGLGLAIARDIAQRQGGQVALTNLAAAAQGAASGLLFRYVQPLPAHEQRLSLS